MRFNQRTPTAVVVRRMTTIVCLTALLGILAGCPKSQPASNGRNAGGSSPTEVASLNEQAIAENNRACGLMGRFDYRDAHAIFESLVQEYPNWVDARVNLAIATLNRQDDGDEQRALEILREALAIDPDHARAHFCSGILLSRTADPSAVDHFRRVVESDPDDAYATYFYASSLEEQGDADAALTWFRKSLELDPYLRSVYHRLSQLMFRSGQTEEGQTFSEMFQRLDDNPRARLVEIIYSKMGPKALVATVGLETPTPTPMPDGPLFESPVDLLTPGANVNIPWASDTRSSITIADIDDDGDLDVFITRAFQNWDGRANAICINDGEGRFALNTDHPLAMITDVNATLWGDVDDDGLTDVYVCRTGGNQLWRQASSGAWADITEASRTANATFDTVDGAIVDADHDGDLDIFCVNADGPNELLNNNRDGTFQPIAEAQGIDGDGRASRQVMVTDLDGDRDADIVVINDSPPHDVYLNDRLWAYTLAPEWMEPLRNADIASLTAGDVEADGAVELISVTPAGQTTLWTMPDRKALARQALDAPAPGDGVALVDINGDATPDLFRAGSDGWTVRAVSDSSQSDHSQPGDARIWTLAYLDAGSGYSVITRVPGHAPTIARPGRGRYNFVGLALTGREDTGDAMRSNTSGIGVEVAARIGSHWTIVDSIDQMSAKGQSLQPLALGLAGHAALDFVEIQWPDGVFQSEVHGVSPQLDTPERNLASGHVESIEEIQRLKSSCPVIFAWNGERLEFVSDVLGVAGMGYLVAPGEYATPRPWENFLMPAGALVPRDGRYIVAISEPMEEACYLDAMELVAYDLPPGWSMTIDERMQIMGPAPTGEAVFFRERQTPARALNTRGEDVTLTVMSVDGVAAPVGPRDHRFLGRLEHTNSLTLEFAQPLTAGDDLVLLADGWVEYPYAQTMFAAWQAGASYEAPTLEARDADGRWHVLLEQFGYPAGMPRQMSLPLPTLPDGCTALRISTNQEIYWDAFAVVTAVPCPTVRQTALQRSRADLRLVGFPAMTWLDQKRPYYDRGILQADWDTRHQHGDYTPFGPVASLLGHVDGSLAIFGPGEEIVVEFDAGLPIPAEGWTRRFVLQVHGWCKDMDLFTAHGETVQPLPPSGAWPEGVERRVGGGR